MIMKKNNNDFALFRLLAILGVCAIFAILPTFQKINNTIPLQEIAVVVGIFVLLWMGILSWKRNRQ